MAHVLEHPYSAWAQRFSAYHGSGDMSERTVDVHVSQSFWDWRLG